MYFEGFRIFYCLLIDTYSKNKTTAFTALYYRNVKFNLHQLKPIKPNRITKKPADTEKASKISV